MIWWNRIKWRPEMPYFTYHHASCYKAANLDSVLCQRGTSILIIIYVYLHFHSNSFHIKFCTKNENVREIPDKLKKSYTQNSWIKHREKCHTKCKFYNQTNHNVMFACEWGFKNDNIKWPGALLLTWFNFNPSMAKQLHPIWCVGWIYLSIPKLQLCNSWSLWTDKWFHLTFYQACDYLSMLGFKLNHVSKRGPR